MPAAGPATTTHSTTMSGSATEVVRRARPRRCRRGRRPAVLGAAIAGVGLVVVVVAMLMKPSAPTGTTDDARLSS